MMEGLIEIGKRLTLKTEKGCRNVMVFLLIIIFVCSFIAMMIKSSGGYVNIQNVKFDARGAVQDAELYKPVGTNSKSSLPCIILSHGGGCTYGVMTGFAQELARRGFVVLNISSYGAGLSGQPMYDEDGSGVDGMPATTQGLWDAVNYVRTLKYVDQTRIAVGGHSMGAYRSAFAALNDCTYYTLNDLMINFMYEQFGIEFPEEEIRLDAASLADKYLTPDQKSFFNIRYSELSEYWNTRIKAIIPIGSLGIQVRGALEPATVHVAGYDVIRYLQTNIGLICGEWDHNFASLSNTVFSTKYFQTGDTVYPLTWLQLSDTGTAVKLGSFDNTSIVNSDALSNAIRNRNTRILVGVPRTTHSLEFLSGPTTTAVIEYAQQVLNYNNGPLTGANKQISPRNIVWLWREYLNTAAMIAMIFMAVTLCAFICKKQYFAGIVTEHSDSDLAPFRKWTTIAYWTFSIIVCAYAYYYSANKRGGILASSKFFPLDGTAAALFNYMYVAAIGLFLLIALTSFLNKKQLGNTKLEKLGINIGFKNICKSLLTSFIILAFCYGSLAIIKYFFGQDYRWWMCIFTEMQPEYWAMAFRYLLVLLPCFFVICSAINYSYTNESEDKSAKNMIITIILGSLGVFINHWINVIGLYSGSDASTFTVKLLSQASINGGLLLFVPISVFIARKTYKLTGSVWTGTFVNSFLSAWMWVSAISSVSVYKGTTIIERIFGF